MCAIWPELLWGWRLLILIRSLEYASKLPRKNKSCYLRFWLLVCLQLCLISNFNVRFKDCTGASSAGLRWLRDLATAAKNEAAIQQLDKLRMTYDPKQTYRTCEFDVPPELVPRLMELEFLSDWNARCLIFSNYPDTRIENRLLLISRRDYNYCELDSCRHVLI